jgi:hypothetical protein
MKKLTPYSGALLTASASFGMLRSWKKYQYKRRYTHMLRSDGQDIGFLLYLGLPS